MLRHIPLQLPKSQIEDLLVGSWQTSFIQVVEGRTPLLARRSRIAERMQSSTVPPANGSGAMVESPYLRAGPLATLDRLLCQRCRGSQLRLAAYQSTLTVSINLDLGVSFNRVDR